MELHDLLGIPLQRKNPSIGRKIIRTILQAITDALHRGEAVYIKGFGTFRVIEKAPRPTPHNILTSRGRNRPTSFAGDRRSYAPRKYVIFQPAMALMAMLNLPAAGTAPSYKERRTQRQWDYAN